MTIQRSLCVYNDLYGGYNDLYDLSGLSLTTKKRFMTSSSPDHVPMRPWLRPRRWTDGGNLYRRGMESSAAAEVNVPCFFLLLVDFKKDVIAGCVRSRNQIDPIFIFLQMPRGGSSKGSFCQVRKKPGNT
jgi:hypothetical protein